MGNAGCCAAEDGSGERSLIVRRTRRCVHVVIRDRDDRFDRRGDRNDRGRAAIAKIVRSVSVVTWATWGCLALKSVAIAACRCVISLARSPMKAISAAVTSVTSELFASRSTIELPKGCRAKCCGTFSYPYPEQADRTCSCWAMRSRAPNVVAAVGVAKAAVASAASVVKAAVASVANVVKAVVVKDVVSRRTS